LIEIGFYCEGLPSNCTSRCGDLIKASDEKCDVISEGCTDCIINEGWTCTSSSCKEICHDGISVGSEKCDAGKNEGCLDDCSGKTPGFECTG